jgi:hypothetical protein
LCQNARFAVVDLGAFHARDEAREPPGHAGVARRAVLVDADRARLDAQLGLEVAVERDVLGDVEALDGTQLVPREMFGTVPDSTAKVMNSRSPAS